MSGEGLQVSDFTRSVIVVDNGRMRGRLGRLSIEGRFVSECSLLLDLWRDPRLVPFSVLF